MLIGTFCPFLFVLVSVLLSASVKRFSVSRMRDFFYDDDDHQEEEEEEEEEEDVHLAASGGWIWATHLLGRQEKSLD